jgi:nicotinamidase-related amidase
MAKTGLIVVDLQRAFSPPPDLVTGIQAILPRYDCVIATQYLNHPGSLFETELNYTKCQLGSRESEIVAPLNPVAVFDRYSYGLQKPHIDMLKKQGVDRWDIAGCDTDACVLATCLALWDNGIRFRVIKELCHSSGGAAVHAAALEILKRNFAQ